MTNRTYTATSKTRTVTSKAYRRGVPAQAREALCFAVLANETVSGNPGNVPAVTGATRGAVLGKISL